MIGCVRGTGQTLSSVDNFVLEDNFCKFWSVLTCGLHFAYYTICWRKRFLETLKSQILNLFVWISAGIGFFPNIR